MSSSKHRSGSIRRPRTAVKIGAVVALILLSSLAGAFGQTLNETDPNQFYRFPLSIGVEYESLTPFGPYSRSFNVFELSSSIFWPIPSMPVLQPTARIGAIQFDSLDSANPKMWDHINWFAEMGIRYATRMSRQFEIGGELLGGYSMAVFPNLLPSTGTYGAHVLVAEAGGLLSLDPSFNLNISVHPSLKYLYFLNPLADFNGFLFSIGFQASYRFGQDPDAPQAVIRSIRFDRVKVPPVFGAMQSFYVKHPIGEVSITNTDRFPIKDVSISFDQKRYMDSPTQSVKIAEIAPGSSATVPLHASFNSQVFTTEGTTPLTGEVIVEYTTNGRAAQQRQSVSYDLHDKTAITWTDDRKVGAFITPADSALRNYASFIRQASKESVLPGLDSNLQYAIQLFGALGEIGLLYQSDPSSPFTVAQDNVEVVDSVSIPRDTLKRTTGDCDDLTVLYDSMLETVGIASGFITTPGHIFAAFNTHVASADYARVNPDRSMTFSVDGEVWVPVEITLIGSAGFMEAWEKGIEEYRRWDRDPSKRKFYTTASAQAVYRPVGLTETDLGLQYGRPEQIVASFRQQTDRLVIILVGPLFKEAQEKGRKQNFNRLGVAYARLDQIEQARSAFEQALAIDPAYLSSRLNLANLRFLSKDYKGAAADYLAAQTVLERNGLNKTAVAAKLLINLSKSYYFLDQPREAQIYFAEAHAIDPTMSSGYDYLASADSQGRVSGRASLALDTRRDIQYFDDSMGGSE